MRNFGPLFPALGMALGLFAQHQAPQPGKVVPRQWPGYGELRFEVRSKSPAAKQWANQGLRLIYAFNHPEAAASFRKATELDPDCGLCWWGLAHALGNNINAPLMPENAGPAYEAAQKAIVAASNGGAREKDYARAIATRYAKDNPADRSALDKAFALEMRRVADTWPDDLDAQVLAADALMNLTPWKLWSLDGKPNTYTLEIVGRLESVLARDPRHLGANHFYIHAVEASKNPDRALPSAALLGSLAPGSGHLVHMPAHIYMRVGDYEEAARVNAKAAALDQAYFKLVAGPTYYLPYWVHNSHFYSAARAMQGRYADGRQAIGEAAKNMEPLARMMPMFEPFLAMPLLYDVRFQKWEKILAVPEPSSFSLTMNNVWHFARGMALAGTGSADKARAELQKFRDGTASLAADRTYGLNSEKDVMAIAALVLEAKIATAEQRWDDAARLLRSAVRAEDTLSYDEPADWTYPPVREALGAVLLRQKEYAEAEKVFREELEHNRRSGRAYFGLWTALKWAGREEEAAMVKPLFDQAWAKADRVLRLEDLF